MDFIIWWYTWMCLITVVLVGCTAPVWIALGVNYLGHADFPRLDRFAETLVRMVDSLLGSPSRQLPDLSKQSRLDWERMKEQEDAWEIRQRRARRRKEEWSQYYLTVMKHAAYKALQEQPVPPPPPPKKSDQGSPD